MKRALFGLIVLFSIFGGVAAQETPIPTPAPATPIAPPQIFFFFTYAQVSGNRYIPTARGTFPNVPGYDIQLGTVPEWIVGAYLNGDIPRFQVRDKLGYTQQVVRPVDSAVPGIVQSRNAEGTPVPSDIASALPVFAVAQGAAGNVRSQDNPTNLTHPIPLAGGQLYLQVTYNGDVAVWNNTDIELARLPLNALRDSRPALSNNGSIALYAGATDQRYVHGVLGDNFEGSRLVVLRLTNQAFGVLTQVDLEGEDVFEGLNPFWADVNADGTEDLVTTISNSTVGSWIRVYLFDGQQFIGQVDSAPVGQGSRWRHVIAFAPFGPNGENELVAVRTPHISGVVEFFRYNAETQALDLVAEQEGFASHVIGTRNLDLAVAADFNGDGQVELVVPSQDRTQVAALQHTAEGVRVMWALPVGSRVITNMLGFVTPSGALGLAYGTDDGRLRLWLPDN
jgi:hypothetical protein